MNEWDNYQVSDSDDEEMNDWDDDDEMNDWNDDGENDSDDEQMNDWDDDEENDWDDDEQAVEVTQLASKQERIDNIFSVSRGHHLCLH